MRILIFILLFASCSFIGNGQQTINASIQHDGSTREYSLYLPAAYSPESNLPLLLCFHGYGSNASNIRQYTHFNDIADTANFIVAYPQGTVHNGTTHWNVGGWIQGSPTNDLEFVDVLLDSLIGEYSIDTTRIYSTGMSNGGYMSFLLACQLSERIAAIASITGSMTPETYNGCDPQRPVPVLQMHGDDDSVVPYTGAIWTKPIDDVIDYWIVHNETDNFAAIDSLENINTSDLSEVVKHAYKNGSSCSSVEHWLVLGGDHDWPGAWGNMDVDASLVAWRFLSKYDINGCVPTSVENFTKEPTLKVYPNPTSSWVLLENAPVGIDEYTVYSSTGVLVRSEKVNHRPIIVNLEGLDQGMYIVSIQDDWVRVLKAE